MMNELENVQIIQRHFEAFWHGNLSGALEFVGDKVDWQSPVTRSLPKEIPWAKPCYSWAEFSLFFKELHDKVQLDRFEIFQFTAQDDRVIVGNEQWKGKGYGTYL